MIYLFISVLQIYIDETHFDRGGGFGNNWHFYLEICFRHENGEAPARPGLDFEALIESFGAGVQYDDYDDVGRALLTGMLFGLELGMTRDVSGWPLRQTFSRK